LQQHWVSKIPQRNTPEVAVRAMRPDHPLTKLFGELVWNTFVRELRQHDTEMAGYLTELLTEFTFMEHVYRIRDASGRRLEDVGEMLIESNPLLSPSGSFDREREVRKHIGDYTLFFTGLFPESLKRPRRTLRLDYWVDYVKAGKESYEVVSKFDQFEYQRVAPLFRRLSENFELCVYVLNRLRDELRKMENRYYQRIEQTLIS
jgi:hypothetical protein